MEKNHNKHSNQGTNTSQDKKHDEGKMTDGQSKRSETAKSTEESTMSRKN